MGNKEIGKCGEDLACAVLQGEGFQILDRNFGNKFGEVDIICMRDNTYLFVEVKTRKYRDEMRPAFSVNQTKVRNFYGTACRYIKEKRISEGEFQLMVMEITYNLDEVSMEYGGMSCM